MSQHGIVWDGGLRVTHQVFRHALFRAALAAIDDLACEIMMHDLCVIFFRHGMAVGGGQNWAAAGRHDAVR